MEFTEFDRADEARATAIARVWAEVPGWVNALVEGRPFGSVDALAAYAGALAEQWSPSDLESALAHHPRIGARVAGADAASSASRREQASMTSADDDLVAAMAAGNARYEERFGRVFLIRAAGRGPAEMLAELERRLGNDPSTETREATAQLAEIAMLRLRETFEAAAGTTEENE